MIRLLDLPDGPGSMNLRIHIDGGARGNPGPAGAGVVVHTDDGVALLEAGYYLGHMTNNQAEYTGLLNALRESARLGGRKLEIHSDSELLVRQINGEYRVKNEQLKGLYQEALSLLKPFEQWRVRHVRREQNARADELANLAMDAGEDVIVIDTGPAMKPPPARKSAGAPASASAKPPTILAQCTKSPDVEACAAPCNAGARYEFTAVTPAGLCVHAAGEVISAVVRAQAAGDSAQVTCPKLGCGARFEVRRA